MRRPEDTQFLMRSPKSSVEENQRKETSLVASASIYFQRSRWGGVVLTYRWRIFCSFPTESIVGG